MNLFSLADSSDINTFVTFKPYSRIGQDGNILRIINTYQLLSYIYRSKLSRAFSFVVQSFNSNLRGRMSLRIGAEKLAKKIEQISMINFFSPSNGEAILSPYSHRQPKAAKEKNQYYPFSLASSIQNRKRCATPFVQAQIS